MAMTVAHRNFETLVLSCNKDGMDALRKGQHKAAFEQLKHAEAILIANKVDGDVTNLSAVTCNNLGCYYKKVGKLHGALSYLRRALNMEVELQSDEVTLAGTHLNICAILSKLEKHDKAVQHALSALDLINQRVSSVEEEKLTQDDYSVLAIAYHNVAVERDFLHQYERAAAAFQQGCEVARRYLGEEHPLAIALGKNCDAVLHKSGKLGKASAIGHKPWTGTLPKQRPDIGAAGAPQMEATGLPSIPGAQQQAAPKQASMPSTLKALREEAAAWATGSFAPQPKKATAPEPSPSQGEQACLALRESQLKDLVYPSFKETSVSRDLVVTAPSSPSKSMSPRGRRIVPVRETLQDEPEAIMDIIDADSTGQKLGPSRFAPNDFRPNRVVKGSTRAARVVRRTGLYQSTKHRDRIMLDNRLRTPGSEYRKRVYSEKVAAERIQRCWRKWRRYREENRDWIDVSTRSATIIQAYYRSYKVRRRKFDEAATAIQRHVRGRRVRKQLVRIRAAITIQRHVIGMLTRMQLAVLQRAAVKMQALIRGFLGRRRALAKRKHLTATAITIQCGVRMMNGKRITRERRSKRAFYQAKVKLALNCQRFYRGWKGRERFASIYAKHQEDLEKYAAATRLQALARRDIAQKRVDEMRAQRLVKMTKAATWICKTWRGYATRRKYTELLNAFARHEKHVITIQRYSRGYLVRTRMWREAVRAEEQLWAALELQRVWRGYLGRVRWENELEKVWRAEMAAAMLQRNFRGWLARSKVSAWRRRIARGEFERARKRYRAAQKVQALIRGALVRARFRLRLQKARAAATSIQRVHRGHVLRKRLWGEVLEMRALLIQARMRGFLVRKRRLHLLAMVIHIQRAYRKWRSLPQDYRASRFAAMRQRKENAAKIQRMYRAHSERQASGQVQLEGGSSQEDEQPPAKEEVEAQVTPATAGEPSEAPPQQQGTAVEEAAQPSQPQGQEGVPEQQDQQPQQDPQPQQEQQQDQDPQPQQDQPQQDQQQQDQQQQDQQQQEQDQEQQQEEQDQEQQQEEQDQEQQQEEQDQEQQQEEQDQEQQQEEQDQEQQQEEQDQEQRKEEEQPTAASGPDEAVEQQAEQPEPGPAQELISEDQAIAATSGEPSEAPPQQQGTQEEAAQPSPLTGAGEQQEQEEQRAPEELTGSAVQATGEAPATKEAEEQPPQPSAEAQESEEQQQERQEELPQPTGGGGEEQAAESSDAVTAPSPAAPDDGQQAGAAQQANQG